MSAVRPARLCPSSGGNRMLAVALYLVGWKKEMITTATVTMKLFQNRNRRRFTTSARRSRKVSCWLIEGSLAARRGAERGAESNRDVPGNLPFSKGEDPTVRKAVNPTKNLTSRPTPGN